MTAGVSAVCPGYRNSPGPSKSRFQNARRARPRSAVESLGRTDGFWGNEPVRIPLPQWLHETEGALRLMGRNQEVDNLHAAINRVAEQALPEVKGLLVSAVRSMSVQDAKAVLIGGENSATQFFEAKTRVPIVATVTQRIGLAQQYDALAKKGQSLGPVHEDMRIEQHVTTRALDGLYLLIGNDKKKDPRRSGRHRQRAAEEGVRCPLGAWAWFAASIRTPRMAALGCDFNWSMQRPGQIYQPALGN